MLLIGKETKEFKLKIHTRGYETNNCFTKFLVTPVRDTSISAAQRARSATSRTNKIQQKLKKLNSMRQQLIEEKGKFDKYEKTTEFFDRIDKIIEDRFKVEEKAAIMIQAIFRGYYYRKIYIQKRIEIDREITKKLVSDMGSFISNCFNNFMGHKAAVVIQKHRRRILAQRILQSSLMQIRDKLLKESQSIVRIQKKFRHFLNYPIMQKAKDDKFRKLRLDYLRKRIMGRKILRFMRNCVIRLTLEREEQRKIITASSRRKGIRNPKRIRPCAHRDDGILSRLSQVLSSDTGDMDMIPNVYSIFRVGRTKNRPLTPSEHTQLQTEASTIRRRSVSIKRSLPKVEVTSISKDLKEDIKELRNSKELKEIKEYKENKVSKPQNQNKPRFTSDYLQNTESTFNRIFSKDQPPTPDFMKHTKKSRKINWTFLKPTISSEILKVTKTSVKSPILSTHFTRSPTPTMTSGVKLPTAVVNPTLCPRFEGNFVYG